jgi:hypothetical protein
MWQIVDTQELSGGPRIEQTRRVFDGMPATDTSDLDGTT